MKTYCMYCQKLTKTKIVHKTYNPCSDRFGIAQEACAICDELKLEYMEKTDEKN